MVLVLQKSMIRDTLEMVPVAIVLAVVLSFGVRPAHRPSTVLPSGTVSATRAVESLASSLIFSPTPSSDTDSVATPHSGDGGAAVEQDLTAIDNVTAVSRTFLPRRSMASDVPYYTAADLPPSPAPARVSSPGSTTSPTATPVGVGADVSSSRGPASKLGLNTCRLEDLVRVPGIGRSRAQLILDQRPPAGYTSWTQVDALPGFGPGTLGTLMQHAVLDAPPTQDDRRNP